MDEGLKRERKAARATRGPRETPKRRPWYLHVLHRGDGPLTMEEFFTNSVDCHMGDEYPDPPPTSEELQHVVYAAKMEMARQLVKRRRGATDNGLLPGWRRKANGDIVRVKSTKPLRPRS